MFKKELKKCRLKANISQDQLAEKLGVSQNTICSYERGTRTPNIYALCELCKALTVSPDELLSEELNS